MVTNQKANNATTLTLIEENLKKLIRDKRDLDQMRADAKYAYDFRRMIVSEPND